MHILQACRRDNAVSNQLWAVGAANCLLVPPLPARPPLSWAAAPCRHARTARHVDVYYYNVTSQLSAAGGLGLVPERGWCSEAQM